jgi:hypothetical protein
MIETEFIRARIRLPVYSYPRRLKLKAQFLQPPTIRRKNISLSAGGGPSAPEIVQHILAAHLAISSPSQNYAYGHGTNVPIDLRC